MSPAEPSDPEDAAWEAWEKRPPLASIKAKLTEKRAAELLGSDAMSS